MLKNFWRALQVLRLVIQHPQFAVWIGIVTIFLVVGYFVMEYYCGEPDEEEPGTADS